MHFAHFSENITVGWFLRLTFWVNINTEIYFMFRYTPSPLFSPCRFSPILD